MKFTIKQKLFFVVSLPIITLSLLSINFINNKYQLLKENKIELSHIQTMKKTSDFVHELQIERGLSASYLNTKSDLYFTTKLLSHKKRTDLALKNYEEEINSLDLSSLSKFHLQYINDIKSILKEFSEIRKKIEKKEIKAKESFDYFTHLNNILIAALTGLEIHANSHETNTEIMALYRIIKLKEYAGQERALIAHLLYVQKLSEKNLRQFHTLLNVQEEKDERIVILLQNSSLNQALQTIQTRYKNNFYRYARETIIKFETKKIILHKIYHIIGYGGMIHDLNLFKVTKKKKFLKDFQDKKIIFNNLTKEYLDLSNPSDQEYQVIKLLQHSFDGLEQDNYTKLDPLTILNYYTKLSDTRLDIDPKKWFEISTQRINDINSVESSLLLHISSSIQDEIDTTYRALLLQIFITFTTIILLLIATFYTANRIKYAINQLENGIDDFFRFLRFEIEDMKDISTKSNDEINDMAQNINANRVRIQEHLEEDQVFINEITQIVTLMRDGDFSDHLYFEPNNPNLKELKSVFEELISLISDKIKEQTEELERLNSSLEDRVYYQTMELEEKLKEITLSRDKAIQAEIAKDEFLANMSHEIRTPLNAILGFVTILKKRVTEEKSLNYLNIINTSGKSLLTIINDILDFSKIQSGKFTIVKHYIEPVEEFSNAVLLFASKAYEKHIIYSVYIDPKMPSSINIDATRVKQILSNLLSNAIKFTPEDGAIKVKVIIKSSNLIISIQDNGIGISKENQTKVFSAFEQADGSTTRKYGGTGLGLSISSKLASLMAGELSLISEENKGSTFTLKIPIDIADEIPKELINKNTINKYTFAILNNCESCKVQTKLLKKYLLDFGVLNILELENFSVQNYDILVFVPDDEYNEEIVHSSKPALALLRTASVKLANLEHVKPLYAPFVPKLIVEAINELGLKSIKTITSLEQKTDDGDDEEQQYTGNILVAEDNRTNQTLIKLILMDYGVKHDIANNGVQAVEMFKNGSYDLVLMDENMPELNGIGAMLQIKEYEKENALIFTPIIALTASVLDTDKEKFLNAGMDGFVGKPIDTKELENIFNIYLKKA